MVTLFTASCLSFKPREPVTALKALVSAKALATLAGSADLEKRRSLASRFCEVGLLCHVIVYVLSIIQIIVNVKIKLKYRCRNTIYKNERHQSVFCYGKFM